ncbi:MAG: PAS domain S-box protein [Thermoleophilia bacterium]|nr:PAS domain S-box protein [Thermoleophilia bacterium]
MPDFDLDTLLITAAGVAALLAVVMIAAWARGAQRGFGLWTLGQVLIAVAFYVLVDREHLSEGALALLIPGFIIVGSTLRLEGLRHFLGREKFDYRVLLVPVLTIAVLACLVFVVDSPPARMIVSMAPVALLCWAMAALIFRRATGRDKVLYRVSGAMYALYGAFLLAFGVAWLVRSYGAELEEIGRPGLLSFFILVMLFEISWVANFLSLNAARTTGDLEAARTAVEAERTQLADLLAFLPDATFAVDGQRRVVAWNRAAEELTGVPASEVLGRPFDEKAREALGDRAETLIDLALEPDKSEAPEQLRELQREQSRLSAEIEIEFPARPGRRRHLWLSVTPLRGADGAVSGAVESMRDVSVRENADRLIWQREEQFRRLFELSFDGILVVAPDGAIQDANAAACEMLGMNKEEIIAAGPTGIIFADADRVDRLESGLPNGQAVSQFTYVRKDGTILPAECVTVSYCDTFGFPRSFAIIRDITERVEAQKVLRESEARLLQAQTVAHVGNWEIDLVARSVWLSPEARRIHGIPETSAYMPFDMADLQRLADDPAQVTDTLQKLTTGGGSFDFEYKIQRLSDGVLRTVHVGGEALRDEAGTPVRLAGVVQDVTELRQVEDALKLVQNSVNHAGDPVFWVDAEGRLVFVNDSVCRLLGFTREELLGLTVYDVDTSLPKDRPDERRQKWEEVRQQCPYTREGEFRTKDGRTIPVEISADHCEHEGREYCFVFAHDISGRKQMEESLRSTHLARGESAEPVLWISPEGRLVYASDSMCQRLGYTCAELHGMTVYDIDPLLSKDWRSVWDRIKRRGSYKHQAVHRTKEGTDIPVEVNANYVQQDGREYGLLFARDVSDRTQAEDALDQTQECIRQAATMEAIGRLAGGIAHDLNNLLTAIMGYGNLILADEQVQGSVVQRDAEEIRAAAERASALTQKILAFSRRQALRPRVVSLNSVLADVEPRLKDLVGEDIEVFIRPAPDLGSAEVDPLQFEEALMDLATNARDGMPDGGQLILETANVDVSEDYTDVYPDLQAGSYVLLSVSDTGVGISPDILGHVFEPFFTTKEPGVGTGLGLPTVYGFIRQSGGFVNVYSEVGRGSTFKLYLPRVEEPAEEAAPEPGVKTERSSGGAETVLVVEDEAPLRRLVARVLGGLGYKVYVAGSGPEALELLDDLEIPPDLLLTDVVLPGGMQGNDVAASFLARVPDLPVLYMSGHARDAIVHSGRLDEGVNFIGKPFTPESLAAKVREVLDAGGMAPRQSAEIINAQDWEP